MDQKVGGSSPSERAQVSGPFRSWEGLLANAGANSGYPAAFMIRAKMSAASASWLLITWAYTRRVIDGVGVAEPGGDDMHLGTGQQQGRRVDMTQIMQPGVR